MNPKETETPIITAKEVIDEAGRGRGGKSKLTKKELFAVHRADQLQYQINELKIEVATLAKQNGDLAKRLDDVLAGLPMRSVPCNDVTNPVPVDVRHEVLTQINRVNQEFVDDVKKKAEPIQKELPTQPFKTLGGFAEQPATASIFTSPTC